MIVRPLLFALVLLTAGPVAADAPPADLAGIYDGGQMELATALELDPDGRFQYYLSYGSLDEMATGRWVVSGDGIELTSDPVNAPAFVLVESLHGTGHGFALTLDVPRGLPVQLFSAAAILADGTGQGGDFEEPSMSFKLARGQAVSAVALAFEMYGVDSGKVEVPPGTIGMRFRFEPNDLGSVAFDNQLFRREGDAFVLDRYGRTLRFTKQQGEGQGE